MALEAPLSTTNDIFNHHTPPCAAAALPAICSSDFRVGGRSGMLRPRRTIDSVIAWEGEGYEAAGGGRRKRKRRPRVCKNKEEAETQRMTHIAVERNRRKLMNEHLAVLRSLMPESYSQRGDQASIVGGAIEFVKELEHHLQLLEAQKLRLGGGGGRATTETAAATPPPEAAGETTPPPPPPFSQFFAHPQYTTAKGTAADIEVTLVETHANVRIRWRRGGGGGRQVSKLVAAFEALHMSVLHLNVTTFHPLVLYSISAKVEGGCQLQSADAIAWGVHHVLIGLTQDELPHPS
ncbi:unnamed protein product [Cuscuta campestris]|uniref:BHLH domain-containing protein n=1 Tax=Cuscuta campestris TaxID=132261 RepID=A0A484KP87_9ASTE|nr:unnamed protein product [Cuscuta campestris]